MNKFNSEEFLKEHLDKAKEVRQLDGNTWEAPSAEHALAWMRFELYWPSWYATETEVEGRKKYEFPSKPIFRGHGNKIWELIPGLLRLQDEERIIEDKATLIFSKVVEDLFANVDTSVRELWPPLNLKSGNATAQHYGMKTALLDWTVNPGVAIDMATNTIKTSKDQQGAVYWLYMNDVEELNIEILFPPPFVYRLYLQRGFFTNILNSEQVTKLSRRVKKILFPIDSYLKCEGIEMDSNKKKQVDLLPINKWFENLYYWSKIKSYRYHPQQGDGMKLYMEFVNEFRSFTFKNPIELHAIFEGGAIHLFVQEYIFHLAAINIKNSNNCFYDPRVINMLKKHNKEYFDWAENILKIDYDRIFVCNE